METKLQAFEHKEPEISFEWHDSQTEAKGWVVINSLRGGAAGGGTRMRKGLDKREVVSLAKTMEIKFSVAGPPIGGAKSGIDFDPSDPRKKGVLERWYAAVKPLLKNYYGTGGDLNVDEIHEVIPMTANLGILHPQEGVVNGHYKGDSPEVRVTQLQQGVVKEISDANFAPLSPTYVVADMITGFGVFEAVRLFYAKKGSSVSGKKVIIQGWGNVASAAAWYFAKNSALIVGIIDRDGGIINEQGLSFDEVNHLFVSKDGNKLASTHMLSFDEVNRKIWEMNAHIFIPAAASRLVQEFQMSRLIDNGLEIVSCGANVPFADIEIFYGPITRFVDQKVALIPDFIANCGMARVFAYLMQTGISLTDEAIFNDVTNTISNAIDEIFESNTSCKNLTKTAFDIALNKLMPSSTSN
jgi:glutamate dehydrogenase/leucine dehydrogenase